MAQQRDLRSTVTSAVIGALLATLILFAYFYFFSRGSDPAPIAPAAAESSK